MKDNPMLMLTVILTALVSAYFIFFGFSPDKWIRYGQYGGLGFCVLFIIDGIFRP